VSASVIECLLRGTRVVATGGSERVGSLRQGGVALLAGGHREAHPIKCLGRRRYPAAVGARRVHLRPARIPCSDSFVGWFAASPQPERGTGQSYWIQAPKERSAKRAGADLAAGVRGPIRGRVARHEGSVLTGRASEPARPMTTSILEVVVGGQIVERLLADQYHIGWDRQSTGGDMCGLAVLIALCALAAVKDDVYGHPLAARRTSDGVPLARDSNVLDALNAPITCPVPRMTSDLNIYSSTSPARHKCACRCAYDFVNLVTAFRQPLSRRETPRLGKIL